MGTRKGGPKPKPIEVLRLSGSKSVYNRRDEVEAVKGDPEPPDWLSDVGKVQWDRMVERMRGMQFLSPMWRESLAQFCESWAEYEGLVIECQGEKRFVISDTGVPHVNPLYTAKDKAWDRVLKMGREFGYTPASKADVKVEKTPQKSDKMRLIKGAS